MKERQILGNKNTKSKLSFPKGHQCRQKLFTLEFHAGFIYLYVETFAYLQCFAFLLALGIVCGYISLVTALIAVACTQFQKLTTAILDIRQQNIKPHYGQEDEQKHIIAICDLQAKLNECIRHHQDIIG